MILLDLRTIYMVAAVSCLGLGALQLLAWLTGRFERWPALWGASNLLLGAGLFCIGLRGAAPDWLSISVGNVVTLAGYGMLLVTVRSFAGRVHPWRSYALLVLLMGALAGLTHQGPEQFAHRLALGSMLAALIDCAVLREAARIARREQLASAWVLAALFVPTLLLYLARAVMAELGMLGDVGLFSGQGGAHPWLALVATLFLSLRGIALFLMSSERAQKRLSLLAQNDPLTGVLNRGGLHDAVARMQQPGRRSADRHRGIDAVALLLIDLDHFKSLNDNHGHARGDDVLRLFTALVKRQSRNGDLVARMGGDEFLVVMPGATLGQAVDAGERLCMAFRTAVAGQAELQVRPTLSIGVTYGAILPEGLDELIKHADQALYQAKRLGRDQVAWAPAMAESLSA